MPGVLCSGEINSKLPSGLTCIDIKNLTSHTDLNDKYVQVTVDHRYQLNQKPVPSIKFILKNNEGSIIELLAIGQVADDLDICVQGDILIFLKFEVEVCPGQCKRDYQMVVDDTSDNGSLVWIFKRSVKNKRTSHTRAHQVTPVKLVPQQKYIYKPLADLKVNTIVDVYGVVKCYKQTTKTKGSDYCCSFGLTDPSFESSDDKLSCIIFSPSEANLPKLSVGNIVRFHRLKIQVYQGNKQGQNGPGFQWLLFRGSVEGREASSNSYTFEKHDEDKVKGLVEWWQKNGSTVSSTGGRKTLSEIQPKEYFDLICQVIRVCILEANGCKLCRVWDGTKFEGPLKMSKEEEFNDTVKEDGILMEASAGLAVDVYLFDNHVASADCILPGDFIQLTNLHAAVVSGQVELTLHGGTWFNRGVITLSRDLPQVRKVETVLNQKLTASNLLVKDVATVESIHKKAVASKTNVLNSNAVERINNETSAENTVKNVFVEKQIPLPSSDVELNVAAVEIVKKFSHGDEYVNGMEILTSISDSQRNEFSGSCEHRQTLDIDTINMETAVNFSEREKIMSLNVQSGYNVDDPIEVLSDSGQSLWFSAYDDSDIESHIQDNNGLALTTNSSCLQDSNISSSGSTADSQSLLSASTRKIETEKDCISATYTIKLGQKPLQSSQESFHTASDLNEAETTADLPKKSAQRTFLSLKRKLDLQEESDDNVIPVTFSKQDVFLLNSSILCFDTVGFTEASPAVNEEQIVCVADTIVDNASSSKLLQSTPQTSLCKYLESESTARRLSPSLCEKKCRHDEDSNVSSSIRSTLTEDSDKVPRCMLKTASTVIGHTLVPKSSFKDVLEHAVPHKFRVLARVQELKPNPVSVAKLVNFVCSQCHHIESAVSINLPFDTEFLEHVCPKSGGQLEKLQPTIILTLLLTDGDHSLVAYLWDKQAVQFFGGIEPLQILTNDECSHHVQELLESLCPQNSSLSDRPLLECCLLSYGTGSSVKYQIFDTMLV